MTTDEKIEALGNVQKTLCEKIKVLEDQAPEYPKIRIPDYTHDLKSVYKVVNDFLGSNHQRKMDSAMQEIKEIVRRMPHVIQIQHHHHFAKLTGRVITAFLILIGCLSLAVWLAIHYYQQTR